MKKDITIIKAPRDEPLSVPQVDFEAFNDLFLMNLENKRKLKPRKRSERFDYEGFHDKLARRRGDASQVTVLRSPPVLSESFVRRDVVVKAPSVIELWRTESVASSRYTAKSMRSSPMSPVKQSLMISSSSVRLSPMKQSPMSQSPMSQSPMKQSPMSRSPTSRSPTSQSPVIQNLVEPSIPNKTPTSQSPVVQNLVEPSIPNKTHVKQTPEKQSPPIQSPPSTEAPTASRQTPTSKPLCIEEKVFFSPPHSVQSSVRSYYSDVEEQVPPRRPPSLTINSFNSSAFISPARSVVVSAASRRDIRSFRSDIVVAATSPCSVRSETEDDERRELLFKFQLLASKNPELVAKYPFNMRSDVKVMRSTYAMILKQISVNNRVDNLNTYLLAGFMGCEYFLGTMGFDMEGFSKHQISSMKSYESLLVELGEKDYMPYGMDKWSVEIRLIATLMFNAFWFIVAKSISNKTNFDLISMMGR